jgi:putative modified peptide
MGGKIDITPDKARELLRLLAEDDDFRMRFEGNPREVLMEWDIEIDEEDLKERGPLRLPSRDEFASELQRSQERDKTGETSGNAAYYIIWKVFGGAMPLVVGDAAN